MILCVFRAEQLTGVPFPREDHFCSQYYSVACSYLCTVAVASWAFLHLLVNFYSPSSNLVMRKFSRLRHLCLVQNVGKDD